MSYPLLRHILTLLLLFFFVPLTYAQNEAQPKLKKNYFFKQYPYEFFFVRSGVQDKQDRLWFPTAGDGIYVYDGTSFTNFTRNDGLCHNDILCIFKDRTDNIWFGTRNGLIRYQPSNRKPDKKDFTNFLITEHVVSRATGAKIPYTYKPADNFVWTIMQDKTGKIWCATNKGIYIYDPRTNEEDGSPLFTQFLDDDGLINKNNLHLKDIQSMVQDKQGAIWFASGNIKGEGICRYDGKSVTSFKPEGTSSFRQIIFGNEGTLYFLNEARGVYAYKPAAAKASGNPTFTNFSRKIGITKDTIVTIKQDKAGNFWFGTGSEPMDHGGSGGLWRYDGKSLKLFTIKDGLSHNSVFGITEDRAGNLWFGTRNTGLCRYDGKSFTDFSDYD